MLTSNNHLILVLFLALVSPTYGGLSWGIWLGADWNDVEGELIQDQKMSPAVRVNIPQFLRVASYFKYATQRITKPRGDEEKCGSVHAELATILPG
jgi:hypothetical protein